jgi:hypothetical protein
MAGRLRSRVHVADERGRIVVFGPDSEVPGWAREKIANPKAWDDSEPTAAAKPPKPESGVATQPPPTRGAGSSRKAWVAYVAAARPDITVTDDMSQREIVAACSEQGG